MATVIEELLMKIGMDADSKSVADFNKITDTAMKTLTRVTVVAGAAGAAIVAYTAKMAGVSDANVKFSEQTGVAYESLQELGFAAEREGASMDSLKSSLAGLTKAAGEASMGAGSGIEAFARLGINIMDAEGNIKSADALLLEASDSLQGFSKAEQTDLISKLGISQDMLLLMQKGTDNIADLRAEARKYGVESTKMGKKSEKLIDNLTNIKQAVFGLLIPLRQFTLDLANSVLPKISDWIAENRKLIAVKFVEYMRMIVAQAKKLAETFVKLMPVFKGMLAGFVAFKALNFAASIAGIVKMVWSLVPAITAATGGLTLIIPAIAAVVAGLTAWFSSSEQGSQVFSYAMERIQGALSELSTVFVGFLNNAGFSVQSLGEMWDQYLAPALEWLVTGVVVTAVEAIVAVINVVTYQFKAWGTVISSVIDGVKNLVEWVQKLDIGEKLSKIKESISGSFDSGISGVKNFFSFGESGTPAPRGAISAGGSTTNNTSSLNANIEVKSNSGDPSAIGQAVKQALESVARNGIENQTVTVLA